MISKMLFGPFVTVIVIDLYALMFLVILENQPVVETTSYYKNHSTQKIRVAIKSTNSCKKTGIQRHRPEWHINIPNDVIKL